MNTDPFEGLAEAIAKQTPVLRSASPEGAALIPFMVKALQAKRHLDLSRIEEPWMYLRSQGFTHAQLTAHIDEAIRQVRASRAQPAEV